MRHTYFNLNFVIVVMVVWSNLDRTCNGFLRELGECNNCSTVVLKTQGTFIDCSNRNFYHVPNCKVSNIKQLSLDSNRIVSIPEDAFQSMNTLEVISLNENKIKFIHEYAFHNLLKLRELYIENNKLNQHSFSKNVFASLGNLEVLHICKNSFYCDKNCTLENAVSALKNLRSLHIQGYGLEFGNTFENLSRLKELKICDADMTSNSKFRGFVNNTIEYIHIDTSIIHKDTFINFKHLKGLDVSGHDTIVNVLEALWPLQNKTFEYLRLGDNSGGYNMAPIVTLTSKHFKYLENICTSELELRSDRILHITHPAFAALKHKSCIKILDVSRNMLTAPMLSEIALFRNLEYLNICCMVKQRIKRNIAEIRNKFTLGRNVRRRKPNQNVPVNNKTFTKVFESETALDRNYTHLSILSRNDSTLIKIRLKPQTIHPNHTRPLQLHKRTPLYVPRKEDDIHSYNVTDHLTKRMAWMNAKIKFSQNQEKTYQSYSSHSNELIYFISPHLKVINTSHMVGESLNLTFHGGEGMAGIDAAFSNFDCNFFIQGIPNLIWLNISYWHCEYIIPSFLQYYSNLQVFVASHANLNKGLTNVPDGSLFKDLTKLEHVDLAYNNLRFLPSKLFQNQSESLKHLILSGNFLFPVPYNLLKLTHLTYLDLSYNNYTLFSNSDIHIIKTLTSRGTRIRLEGNKLICTCDTGDFIRWLFTIKTMIDFERIHCVMNNGTWRFLTDMDNVKYDIDLGCSSKFWLIFAISGISMLTGVLILSVIAYRYRLEVEFLFFRIKWWLFPIPPSNDYIHDVFVAASNEDVPFVCRELIKFLDEQVKVKTFYYHKDALPAESIGDMICENISKSRKIIFVITDAFLKSPWLGFELDQARQYMYKMYSEKNILIILKGDISIKKCPDIIKTLHSKILFLQYPNDETEEEINIFWKKLAKCFDNHVTVRNAEATCSHSRNKPV